MILYRQAKQLLAALRESGALVPTAITQVTARHPCFQNVAYPLAFPPLLIDVAAIEQIRELAEAYVSVLEEVVRLYRNDAQVRSFFGLASGAMELIRAEGEQARAIMFCRLDGYIEANSGQLRILENNTDCPAGTLFTPRLNKLIREVIAPFLEVSPALTMDTEDPFTDILLSGAKRATSRQRLNIAVLQPHGKANVESGELVQVLRSQGHSSNVVDPRDLELSDDGLVWGDRRLDLVWNKINMSAWTKLVDDSPQMLDTMLRAVIHPGAPVIFNSYGARHVAESKTSLAFLHDARFRSRFVTEDQLLIDRLIPWTVRLDHETQVSFEGKDWMVEKLVRERRLDLVLKQQYDIRGDGVTVGRATTAADWNKAVAASWGTGAVLQQYVAPSRYPVHRVGGVEVEQLNFSLDSFVFNGRLAGLGAKASNEHRVNLFQGGSKLAVVAAVA